MNRFAKRRLFHPKAGARGGKRNGTYFRSSWEYNMSLVLTAMQERGDISGWQYESTEFSFPVKRGRRFYKPDFTVDYGDRIGVKYWEVKGHMDKDSATALKRMAKYFPAVTVLIVGKKEYAEFSSEFGDLPNWERE